MYTEVPPLTPDQQQALDEWLGYVKGQDAAPIQEWCDWEEYTAKQQAAYLRCIALGISPDDLSTAFYKAFTFRV